MAERSETKDVRCVRRENVDLFFIDYKKIRHLHYLIPLILALIFTAAGLLLILKVFPIEYEYLNYIAYGLFGGAGICLFTTIGVFVKGIDTTIVPTEAQIETMLKEDIDGVISRANSQLTADFSPKNTMQYVVCNHCKENIYGFIPRTRKTHSGKQLCSLNKITVFSFGAKRVQIYVSVVDTCTGIELLQNNIKFLYKDITNTYIAYETRLLGDSIQFTHELKAGKNVIPPRFISAVKTYREILRIKVSNPIRSENEFYDIIVADYEIYHTNQGIFKNIYTINNGKGIETEFMKRCDNFGMLLREEEPADQTTAPKNSALFGNKYNFIDSVEFFS